MSKLTIGFSVILLLLSVNGRGNNSWPREITLDNGVKITMYQPQPESLSGNKLVTREVVSVRKSKNEEPVFGVVWTEATLVTDKDSRTATLESIEVTGVKFPDVTDQAKIDALSTILESEIPRWKLDVAIDEIVATLEEEQPKQDDQFNTTAPEIIYRSEPTTLVLIDGEPKVEKDEQINMERVINTAFLIIKNPDDKKYWLYAGTIWYVSSDVTSGWGVSKNLTQTIKSIDTELKKQEAGNQQGTAPASGAKPPAILVITKPAELLQTNGEASFASVQGTGLLYVSNTEDNIFKCVEDQQYYVLLSGRWYKAAELKGPWSFIASDKLPADFAKIPEGSEKDGVLAFVAGTDAAREAVMDAQIPQTAKVDRNSTDCTVKYDGEPKFEPIEGTSLQLAMNTSSTVILAEGKYYAVEKGVWFVADKPTGPWKVSTERPADVDKIPPESQAYNVQYVYVYETTPEYVYVGYTPGYMGCYVYGPTVIYGTGYYYSPWYGPYYYPRPVTWGFSMHYNPWTGWSMGVGFNYGFFSFSVGFGGYGGYWGCPGYHPPYHHPGYGGHYGNTYIDRDTEINIDNGRTNNIYNKRNDATTKDLSRGPSASTRDVPSNRASSGGNKAGTRPSAGQQPSQRPSTGTGASNKASSSNPRPNTKASNNMYSDKSGNVYRQDSKGDWQQRSNNSWQSSSSSQMDRSSQMRDRGTMRTNNASQMSRPSGGYSGGSRGGGGFRR